jgi:ribonuclease R
MSRNQPWRQRPRSHVPGSRKPSTPKPSHAPRPAVFVEGILQLKGAFGFVLSEDPKVGDVMVTGPGLKLAMGGDRVRARVTSPPEAERRSGEIVEVLVHARSTIVGTFRRMGNLPVVVPEDEGPILHLKELGSLVPHVGDIVTARVEIWATLEKAASGALTGILGQRDAPGVDLAILIKKHELPDAFPPEAAAEADRFGSDVPESAWQNRETFFDQRVFTIDGADAKDFDDAVHLEKRPDGGWRLGVHIADVAQYVKQGTPLDEEAYRRGTSVYLSGTVIPMLPFPLSDNLCSLRPDVVRLTLSCVMDITPDGHVASARILESAIRSARRFTYEEVEAVIQDTPVSNVTPAIAADVREMAALARLLRKNRFGRGSLDFDFPEPDVVTDLKGRPTDIRRRERLESHRLIEDFMLLANESVARHMQAHPFLYRIHETPDPVKLDKLHGSLEVLGIHTPKHLDPTHPSVLANVIKASSGTPVQALVHLMVLRSLKQAVYSPVNKGHYGLASKCYTHFTSPIRRYPDLIVHRILKEGLQQRARDAYWKQALPAIAGHTSKRERIAVDAEREYLDIQKVRLMETRVGQTFSGVISSVTNFGLFVQLNEFFVEGLVHITHLGKDYFVYDEARMTLRGRRSGQTYAMGQKVQIRLAAANVLKRQLDFQLLSSESSRPPKSGHPDRPTSAHPDRPASQHPERHPPQHRHRRHRRKDRG